jgi:hypothetical protein
MIVARNKQKITNRNTTTLPAEGNNSKRPIIVFNNCQVTNNKTRGSVGWTCVAHLPFCFEERGRGVKVQNRDHSPLLLFGDATVP